MQDQDEPVDSMIMDEKKERTLGALERIVAASFGGAVTAFVVTPFDVVKARLQAQITLRGQVLKPDQFRGTMDAFFRIGREEGFRKLWRGLPPTLVLAIPNTALYISTYEMFKENIEATFGLGETVSPLVAGLSARVLTASIVSPIELIRTHLQATPSGSSVEHGIWKTWQGLYSSRGGLRSLWSGLPPTLMRDAPFSAIYWFNYEWFKRIILRHYKGDSRLLIDLVSGACAGGIAAIITTPFDVIKTRRQMKLDMGSERSTGPRKTLDIMRSIVKQEGVRGLTKGMVPRTVKVAPACAIMISSYQFCKQYLQQL